MKITIKNKDIIKKFNDIEIGQCFIDEHDYGNTPRIHMRMSTGDFNSVCLNDGAVTNYTTDKELKIITVDMEVTL